MINDEKSQNNSLCFHYMGTKWIKSYSSLDIARNQISYLNPSSVNPRMVARDHLRLHEKIKFML